jgi:hypothetical protein
MRWSRRNWDQGLDDEIQARFAMEVKRRMERGETLATNDGYRVLVKRKRPRLLGSGRFFRCLLNGTSTSCLIFHVPLSKALRVAERRETKPGASR